MNRSLALFLLVLCLAGGASAQQSLEIIPLRHRTVEQVLPVLQPLVEPGGTLSGSRGQLFLRASPANVAEIKRALEAIDRPSRRLEILVRFDDARERSDRALGASGTISSHGSHVDITARDSRRTGTERVDQRLQVLEGGRAFIFSAQDLPTGFEVLPRLAGGSVILEIYQQRQTQAASTTLTTRLGEWTEIAGIASNAARDDRGIAAASSARAAQSRRVWVKVEELR